MENADEDWLEVEFDTPMHVTGIDFFLNDTAGKVCTSVLPPSSLSLTPSSFIILHLILHPMVKRMKGNEG